MPQKSQGTYVVVAVVVLAIIAGYYLLNTPDRRTPGDKIGDAASELSNGVDKASRELQDRTPGEKIGDAVKDAGDDIKKATDGQ